MPVTVYMVSGEVVVDRQKQQRGRWERCASSRGEEARVVENKVEGRR